MNTFNIQRKINVLFLALLLLANISISKKISKQNNKENLNQKSQSLRSILGLPERHSSSLLSTSTKQDPSTTSRQMENSGYLFYGYNLYRRNPHSTTGSIDPGFTNPIFDSDYSGNIKTGDLRFAVPNGSIFAKNVGCDVSMSNSEIKGISSYKQALDVDVSVSGGFVGVSFAASASFKQVSEGMKSTTDIFVEQKADCRVFQGHIEYYDPPLFYYTFLKALKHLETKDFDKSKDDYYTFIDYYGTHFLEKIIMGARYGFLRKMSAEDYTTFKSTSAKVSIGGGYGGLSASASAGTDSSSSNSGSNSSGSTKVFSIGAAPPANGDAMTWASSAISEPMPISYKLRPMMEIFNNPLFNLTQLDNHKMDIGKLKGNMQKAYDNYCPDYLKKIGALSYCKESEIPAAQLQNKPEVKIEEVKLDLSSVVMVKNLGTNNCLTVQGINIVSSPCDEKNDFQKFFFFYIDNTVSYRMLSVKVKGKVADRAVAGVTQLLLWDSHHGPNQRITLKKKDVNVYVYAIDNKCLQVKDQNTAENASLIFEDCREDRAQQWRVTKMQV